MTEHWIIDPPNPDRRCTCSATKNHDNRQRPLDVEHAEPTDPRALLDAYARTYPMNKAAHELADALRAVLDIHQPHPPSMLSSDRYCLECTDEYVADWPCPTARAIVTALEAP